MRNFMSVNYNGQNLFILLKKQRKKNVQNTKKLNKRKLMNSPVKKSSLKTNSLKVAINWDATHEIVCKRK